jgi:predicted metal-binding protein
MLCENKHYYSGSYCKTCGTPPEKKKPKPIAKNSKKRLKENMEYSKIREAYLKDFPVCEVLNCLNRATEIHHMQGRIGALLTDVNHFLAVCESCHKYIHDNPAWSREQGYVELRSL